MTTEADRRERIEAALQRYESRDKMKPRRKRKAVKLFSVDKPQGLTSELALTGQSKPTWRHINNEQDQSR
jgi:hypothetical protein